jgi:quercetin dioxygenase-like cupin family protein
LYQKQSCGIIIGEFGGCAASNTICIVFGGIAAKHHTNIFYRSQSMNTFPDGRWLPIWPGVDRLTLSSGTTMSQMLVKLAEGGKVAEHRHPNEQITYLLSGRLRFFLNGEPQELGPGDSVYIPANVPHAVDVLEASLALDTFSPPREDLLAQDREG